MFEGLRKMNIVLVEDDEILSIVMKEELSKAGFKVFVAADGEAGLGLIKSKKPNLVLLDLMLTKKTGFEVLEELKKSPDTKDIPVIILSVLSTDEDIQKSYKLGADEYFVKSQHTVSELIEKIKNFITNKPK